MAAGKGLLAKFTYAWVERRDANGYGKGTLITPDAPSNGTVYPAYLIDHPVTFAAPTPQRGVATLHAGQTIGQQTDTGISSYGTGTLTLGEDDDTMNAMVSDSSVDTTTPSGWTTTTENVNGVPPQLILGIIQGFTLSTGAVEWVTRVYHNCQLTKTPPGANQNSGENPNPLTYTLIPSIASRSGLGRLFSASALRVTRNLDMSTSYRYTAPIYPVTYVDDGSTGTFTYPYRPVSSDNTGAATNNITKNGATLAVTSVSIITGLITQTAPASAGDIIRAALPTNFVAL